MASLRLKGGTYYFDGEGNMFSIKIVPYLIRTILSFGILFIFYFLTQILLIEEGSLLPSDQVIYSLMILSDCAFAFFVIFVKERKSTFILALIAFILNVSITLYYIFKPSFVNIDAILILIGFLLANGLLIISQFLIVYFQMKEDEVLRSKMIIALILLLIGMLTLYIFGLLRIIHFFALAPEGKIFIYGASLVQGMIYEGLTVGCPQCEVSIWNIVAVIGIIGGSLLGAGLLFYYFVYKKQKELDPNASVWNAVNRSTWGKSGSASSGTSPKGKKSGSI